MKTTDEKKLRSEFKEKHFLGNEAYTNEVADYWIEKIKQAVAQREKKIICSAIKMADGSIIRGHRHHDCIRTVREIPGLKGIQLKRGFMNSDNQFTSREDARIIEETRRINEKDESRPPFIHDTRLFSEDLY